MFDKQVEEQHLSFQKLITVPVQTVQEVFKNSVIKLFNLKPNRRGAISQSKLVLDLRTMTFKRKKPILITISKISSKLEKVNIIFVLEVINLQSSILKKRKTNLNYNYVFLIIYHW